MEIITKKDGSRLTIALKGRMDAVTAEDLGKVIQSELSDVTELIFDLKDLTYTSSAGLRQFLVAQKIMDGQGSMAIRNVNEMVMDIFEETGFSNIFNIEK